MVVVGPRKAMKGDKGGGLWYVLGLPVSPYLCEGE